MTLCGDWQVALLEISTPEFVRSVTEVKLWFQKALRAQSRQFILLTKIFQADDQGLSQWEYRSCLEKNQQWNLVDQKYVT